MNIVEVSPKDFLCDISKKVMNILGDKFKVTVESDLRKSPMVLKITVEEYQKNNKECKIKITH